MDEAPRPDTSSCFGRGFTPTPPLGRHTAVPFHAHTHTSTHRRVLAADALAPPCFPLYVCSAAKRFKVTSTGKLLRHYAGKAHLLRKKRPQHLQKLRRVGSCNDAELDTYQKMLLVFPKKK